jgi:AraC family transcriptional regulator
MKSKICNIKIELSKNSITYKKESEYVMQRHNHTALQVLIPLQSSSFTIFTDNENKLMESKVLGSGNICIIPPYMFHEVTWKANAHFVNLYITPEFIADNAQRPFDYESEVFEAQLGIHDEYLWQNALMISPFLMKYHETKSEGFYESWLTIISNYLLEKYLVPDSERIFFNCLEQIPCDKTKKAILFMENNLDKRLKLEDIADIAGLSQYYFLRRFKQIMGMSPNQYHLFLRLDKAKYYLSQTDLSFIDIAYELGFSTQAHFNNVFKKETGMTPSRFRNKFRQNIPL